jgi:phosphoserine phosphatase RsbU/P
LIQRQQALGRIEHDIQVARRIHEGFLPSALPAIAGWQIDARYRPARQVGGDFYDAFTLGDGRFLAVVVADICDKGVGAALFMALTRSLIRAFAEHHDRARPLPALGEGTSAALTHHVAVAAAAELASAAVTSTNAYIVAHHLDLTMFATVFFGIVHVASGALVYLNAGHCPPIVVSAAGGIGRRLPPTGPAVGMFADAEFGIQEDRLVAGETLLAFSDGATDARNPAGGLLGEAGLIALLTQSAPAATAAALLDLIESGVRNHIGDAPPYDDLTLLALRR